MNAPTLTLPVHLTVGEHTVEVGELTLAPGEPVAPLLAALFRHSAERCEAIREGGGDGAP